MAAQLSLSFGSFSWTQEREDALRLLWNRTGDSAAEIGRMLGNAVIGKAYRMGLKPRGPRCRDPRFPMVA